MLKNLTPIACAVALTTGSLLLAVPGEQAHGSVLAATTSALAAAPGEARRAARPQRQRPRSGEAVTTQTRTENGWQRRTTVTGADGRQASRNTDVIVDRENRSYNRSTVATGPEGRQVTTEVNGSHDPETGFTRNKVKTLPNGNTVTTDSNRFYDPETRTLTKTRTKTGPNGESTTRTFTRQRNEAEASE